MPRSRRGSTTIGVAVIAGFATLVAVSEPLTPRPSLPERIADSTFWRIVSTFSEPSGVFASENFVSNETEWQYVIPPSLNRIKPGGAYIGVGPEQNFTYISAFKPGIAFIPDIRRQNMLLHLMYKALFEMSTDRADFLAKLWSRPRPPGLDSTSTGAGLDSTYRKVKQDTLLFDINISGILTQLVRRHNFAINSEDSATIRTVYGVFYALGPDISYSASSRNMGNSLSSLIGGITLPPPSRGSISTYWVTMNGVSNTYYISYDSAGKQIVMRDSAGVKVRDTTFAPSRLPGTITSRVSGVGSMIPSMYATFGSLMGLDDGAGVNRGWLGSEAAFQWMKDFESRNLLIPVVGNFGGPKALRAVASYIREHDAKVSAFYTSNVEQYLFQNAIAADFYENVATFPTDESSTFIRSIPSQYNSYVAPRNPGSRLAQTTSSIDSIVAAYRRGKLVSYQVLQQLQDR